MCPQAPSSASGTRRWALTATNWLVCFQLTKLGRLILQRLLIAIGLAEKGRLIGGG